METAQNIDKKTLWKILAILAVVAVVIVLVIVYANTFKNLKGKSSGQEKPTTSFPSEQKNKPRLSRPFRLLQQHRFLGPERTPAIRYESVLAIRMP